jgi:diaminopimelate epimerase
MRLEFEKMNGAGNDFVMLDNRELSLNLTKEQIAHLCDRHRGIGADGLLAVEPAETGDAHFRMRYYNADGGEAEMCGNGARCFGRFANKILGGAFDSIQFETIAGIIGASFVGDNVQIKLSEPFDLSMENQVNLLGETTVIHSVNTGVPHAVIMVDDLDAVNIRQSGAAVRFHDHFKPAGTNVNFETVLEPGLLAIRTYERGVEDETLACGTGIAASAIIHNQLTGAEPPIREKVAGGDTLEVGFERDGTSYRNVTLTGPADFVFAGSIDI